MTNLVAITALLSSAALIFFISVVAVIFADDEFKHRWTALSAWLILSVFAVLLAFLAGRIWS